MSKCKCKWRRDGVVFNENCAKIIRRWFCEIAEHLRRGEKRDKKYEYAVKICFGSEEDYTSASERRLV